MKYLLIISLLFVTACSSNYAYKPGSLASEDNQRRDYKICEDKAFDRFFAAKPSGRLHRASVGVGLIPTLTTMLITDAVVTGLNTQANGDKMTEDDISPMIDKCMASKGYLNKD